MDRLLEEARKKEEEKAKEMVMMVRVETFQTMQQDIVQLKAELGIANQKIHDKDKEIDHLKENYKQLQVDAQEERRTAEQNIADLREENENLNRDLTEMETRCMDAASIPSKNNPERPAPKTSSGSSLVQPRDKSRRFVAGYTTTTTNKKRKN